MKVPGLEGNWQQRLQTFGKKFFGTNYTGSPQQNNDLYNKIRKGEYGTVQEQPTVKQPTKSGEVPQYLEQYQTLAQEVKAAEDTPFKSDEEIKEEIKKEVETPIPEAPKLEEYYKESREEYGIDQTEAEINDLKALERELYATLRQRKTAEEGKTVAMGVMAGRIGEIERQEKENLDFIQRELAYKVDQVNSAYGAIEMMMNIKGTDFQNAMTEYNAIFNQKIQIYEQFREVKKEQLDEYHRQQEMARANLEIYIGAIKDGNLAYDSLDENTKIAITKLEIQSGLGEGFVSKLKLAPGEDIKSITTRVDAAGNTYADIIRVDKDGKIYVESKYVGKTKVASSGGTSGTTKAPKITSSMVNAMSSAFKNVDMDRTKASGEQYDKRMDQAEADALMKQAYGIAGGNEELAYELYYMIWDQGYDYVEWDKPK